nr:hypothetical protein [Tanacetum cinerariifolium]
DVEDDEDELYRDVNINLEGRVVQMADVHTTQEFEDTHVTQTPAPTSVASLTLSAPTLTPSTIATVSTIPQAPTPPTTAQSTLLQDLPNFGLLFGFDHRLKTLEANFFELLQTNQFAGVSDRFCYNAQAENEEFLENLDENIQKIIKEQVKEHVKVQVSKILLKIEKNVNEQLEAEVLTGSSNSSNTYYAVVADLSEMELKKILIEKMEGNKDVVMMMRTKMKNPLLDQTGGPRGDEKEKEPESTSAPKEKATRITGKSTQGSKSQQKTTSESAPAEEPMQTTHDLEEPLNPEFVIATRGSIQRWISEQAKQVDSRSSFNGLMDTLVDFLAFLMNQLKVDTLTSELLAGPTYELMKGSCKSLSLPLIPNSRGRRVIPFDHFTNNDLEYLCEGAYSRKYTTSVTKTKATDYGHIKWIEDLVPSTMWSQEPVSYDKHAPWGISHWGRKHQQFYGFVVNRESSRDVYSKRRIIAVTERQIVEWHNYEHLDWITLTNLTVEERSAFNVSLRMFTRRIVIQRLVEDLQPVESYQKKLNLTKPDMYRFDLTRKEAYTAYSNPRGFTCQNKDKQNRLIRIDELHKFSNGTLNDVRTALDDRLKGIRMKYLPQTIWWKSDKERAAAMIQAIDKQLKMRRITRSLEKFVGGRLYEGDFRMLQRTI